jgi:hypothetical protein
MVEFLIFGVMRQVRGEAIFDTVRGAPVNKKKKTNKNLNPFFRRFLMFEK